MPNLQFQVDAQMDKEAAMLAALDHDNVVKMFGVSKASDQQSLYLVLELMNMGDLKTYVKNREPQCENYSQFPPSLLPTELINIAQQVST
jgi:serine/threonine protein kinase